MSPSSTLFDFPHAAVGSDAIYVSGNLGIGGTKVSEKEKAELAALASALGVSAS